MYWRGVAATGELGAGSSTVAAAGLTLGWLAGLVGTRLWPAWRGLGPCTQRGGRCVTCISTYGRERTGRVRSFSPRRSKVRRCRSRAGRDAGAQPVAGTYMYMRYVGCGWSSAHALIAVMLNGKRLQNGITPALHDTTHVWGDTPHKRHARLAPLRARRAAARARTSRTGNCRGRQARADKRRAWPWSVSPSFRLVAARRGLESGPEASKAAAAARRDLWSHRAVAKSRNQTPPWVASPQDKTRKRPISRRHRDLQA